MKRGKLILVVGASGAGKDTAIRAAREMLEEEMRRALLPGELVNGNPEVPWFYFPRRFITRASRASEDHEPITVEEFGRRDFALAWKAHGLHYGIPASIVPALSEGAVVIVNVSRSIIAEARRRFCCFVVEVTAPQALRAARLIARGREPTCDIGHRLTRETVAFTADATIVNDAMPEAAGAILAQIIRRCAGRIAS